MYVGMANSATRYYIGISNICALLGYGDESNPIAQALKITRPSHTKSQDQPMPDLETPASPSPSVTAGKQFLSACKLFNATYNAVCRRSGVPNTLPFLHVTLVFIHHLTFFPDAMTHVAPHFPWKLTALMLNAFIGPSSSQNISQALARFLKGGEPFSSWNEKQEEEKKKNDGAEAGKSRAGPPKRRPLPEDFALRGFPFVEKYFPDKWFEGDIDSDHKYLEVQPRTGERVERVLWLGCCIAEMEGKWLRFDKKKWQFEVGYEVDLNL